MRGAFQMDAAGSAEGDDECREEAWASQGGAFEARAHGYMERCMLHQKCKSPGGCALDCAPHFGFLRIHVGSMVASQRKKCNCLAGSDECSDTLCERLLDSENDSFVTGEARCTDDEDCRDHSCCRDKSHHDESVSEVREESGPEVMSAL